MSQITSNIYIGNINDASNFLWLKQCGITHIVNAAMEVPNFFPQHFHYLRLNLNDSFDQDLSQALAKSNDFMRKAIYNKKCKVFVHCAAGISRSSSQIIHFLMKNHNMCYDEAYKYMKSIHIHTQPNWGFEAQLRLYDVCQVIY